MISKFKLKRFLKIFNEYILVILQFFIIIFHFIKWDLIPSKEIIQANSIFNILGFLVILCSSLFMLMAIKELGSNFSPLPKPIAKGNLITSGTYSFVRHPMYYSLIFISFGFFIIKLSFYHLFLTISLAFIIKFKIMSEEKYLNNKFKNYYLYVEKVKI